MDRGWRRTGLSESKNDPEQGFICLGKDLSVASFNTIGFFAHGYQVRGSSVDANIHR